MHYRDFWFRRVLGFRSLRPHPLSWAVSWRGSPGLEVVGLYFDEGDVLPVGSYCALEGDLGESVMGPCGFSARESAQEGSGGPAGDGNGRSVAQQNSFATGPFTVSYYTGLYEGSS